MKRHEWVAASIARAKATLHDGTIVTLVGIPKASGRRARVEHDNGRRRTIKLDDIAQLHKET